MNAQRDVLGDRHPNLFHSMNAVGMCLNSQGTSKEAEVLLRDALAGRRDVLDEGHPHVLVSMTNLATCLQSQGKLAEAEAMLRASLGGQWITFAETMTLEHLWATRTRRALTKAVTPPRVITRTRAVNLRGRLNPVLGLPKLKLKLKI